MSTKKTKDQEAQLPAVLTQNDVPTMLEMIKKQIKAIKGNVPETPLTQVDLEPFGKIENIKTVAELIKATASVRGREHAYNAAAKEILPDGIKKPKFVINGVTPDRWVEHIQSKVKIVANQTQLKKLQKIQKTLEENLSAEAKLANDLANIKKAMLDEEE